MDFSKTDLVSTLKEAGYSDISSHDWLRSMVIVGQVSLGIVLTVGAGLLITSFLKLTRMDEGFTPDHLLTFTFDLPDSAYQDTRPQFYRNISRNCGLCRESSRLPGRTTCP